MRKIDSGGSRAQWENRLIDELSFIKQKHRYRFSRPLIVFSFTALIPLFFLPVYIGLFTKSKESDVSRIIIFLGCLLPLLAVRARNYWSSIRFQSISTPFFANENQQLIADFLQQMNLSIFQHPDAPEVFQILSREVDEQREVMVFIADDRKILVNSHFVRNGKEFSLRGSSSQDKKMIKALKSWIDSALAPVRTGAKNSNKLY